MDRDQFIQITRKCDHYQEKYKNNAKPLRTTTTHIKVHPLLPNYLNKITPNGF